MKWTKAGAGFETEGAGRAWWVRKLESGFALAVDGGFVAGGFKSSPEAMSEADRIAAAKDVEAAVKAARQAGGDRMRKRWARKARKSHGRKPA